MKHTLIITTVALLLTACGGGSTSSDTANTPTEVLVTNTDGGKTDITGTWLGTCVPGIPGSFFDSVAVETFSGNTHKVTINDYPSADGTCSGTATGFTLPSTFIIQADITTVGWKDGTGTPPTPPMAQNGAGALPATPSATALFETETINNTTRTVARVVDATNTSNIVMYVVAIDNVNGSLVEKLLYYTKQ